MPFLSSMPLCFGCSVLGRLNFYLKGITVLWPHAMVTFTCKIDLLSSMRSALIMQYTTSAPSFCSSDQSDSHSQPVATVGLLQCEMNW